MTVAYTCTCGRPVVFGVHHDCAPPEREAVGKTADSSSALSVVGELERASRSGSAPKLGPDSSGSREAPTGPGVLNAPAPCPAALSGPRYHGDTT